MLTRLIPIVSLAFAVTLSAISYAQAQALTNPQDVMNAVGNAFRKADSGSMVSLSAKQVEIDFGEGSSMYTKDQARYVFSSFFKKHPPSEFSMGDVSVLQGLGTARGRYLSKDSNRHWEVFMRLAKSGSDWEVKEVRISPPSSRQR